jgi:hypothetical protein
LELSTVKGPVTVREVIGREFPEKLFKTTVWALLVEPALREGKARAEGVNCELAFWENEVTGRRHKEDRSIEQRDRKAIEMNPTDVVGQKANLERSSSAGRLGHSRLLAGASSGGGVPQLDT